MLSEAAYRCHNFFFYFIFCIFFNMLIRDFQNDQFFYRCNIFVRSKIKLNAEKDDNFGLFKQGMWLRAMAYWSE